MQEIYLLLGIPISLFAAGIPTAFYILLIWWFDRYEKEPLTLLVVAFLWGSIGSIIVSIVAETILNIPVALMSLENASLVGSTLIAPVVEEIAKGSLILLFFLVAHREFDDILDGIIYGSVIGAGFAMTEDLFYFVNAFYTRGFGAFAILVVMRTGVFGLSHSLYTGITGLGFGLIRYTKSWLKRIFFPVLFLGIAIGIHATHNLFLELTRYQGWTFVITILSDWSWLIVLIVIGILSWKKERKWIMEELKVEVELGTLNQDEYTMIESYKKRFVSRWKAFFQNGLFAYFRTGRFFQLGSELAFKRHEMKVMGNEEGHSKEISELRAKIAKARERLNK